MSNPTPETYNLFQAAYVHFNSSLFDSKLPPCLVTLQRHKGAYGYFSGDRFSRGTDVTDEIAMNPQHFASRSLGEVLSTLVHEMCHLWQHHFGQQKSRGRYHNSEWGQRMKMVGLHPSSTGYPGGKETGDKVSHYIMSGERFEAAWEAFIAAHPSASLYSDAAASGASKSGGRSAASKTKFTCAGCGLNVWAKPSARVNCSSCNLELEEAEP